MCSWKLYYYQWSCCIQPCEGIIAIGKNHHRIVHALTLSMYNDLANLMKCTKRLSVSSRRSKRYMKQCRWTGTSIDLVAIANSNRMSSAAPLHIKKDVSPSRPTRRKSNCFQILPSIHYFSNMYWISDHKDAGKRSKSMCTASLLCDVHNFFCTNTKLYLFCLHICILFLIIKSATF